MLSSEEVNILYPLLLPMTIQQLQGIDDCSSGRDFGQIKEPSTLLRLRTLISDLSILLLAISIQGRRGWKQVGISITCQAARLEAEFWC